MAQQTIGLGTVDNDGTGDTLRAAGTKINANFTELYAGLVGLFKVKGATDCSSNPNYPAATKGDAYVVTVAGKIGGASGTSVDIGDVYVASADNAGGTQASVGASWFVLEHNLVGAILAAGGTMTGALNWAPAVDVASASTTDIGAAASNVVRITGTTTITGLGTIAAGAMRWVRFAGALTLTYNATSLILPGAANIITAAGDTAVFVSEGSGNWRCLGYDRASVTPVAEVTYTPTVSATTPAGSGFTATVAESSYVKNGPLCQVSLQFTITALGSVPAASGQPTITLPFTAAKAGTFVGTENAFSGDLLQGNVSAGSNILTIKRYDGGTTLSSSGQLLAVGSQIRMNLVYRV